MVVFGIDRQQTLLQELARQIENDPSLAEVRLENDSKNPFQTQDPWPLRLPDPPEPNPSPQPSLLCSATGSVREQLEFAQFELISSIQVFVPWLP